jgi:hypothetical protein
LAATALTKGHYEHIAFNRQLIGFLPCYIRAGALSCLCSFSPQPGVRL